MDAKSKSELARGKIGGALPYKVINYAFAVVFFAGVLLAVVWSPAGRLNPNWMWTLLAAWLGIAVSLVISRLFYQIKAPSEVVLTLAAGAVFVLILVAQVYIGSVLLPQMYSASAFGPVFAAAENYVLNGVRSSNYFLLNPGDAGLYTIVRLYMAFLHLFGVSSFGLPMMILNMVAINGAILLLFFCVYKVFGSGKALFALVICLFTSPFILYVPFCTAEVLALPIPIGMALLWIRARHHWREGNFKQALIRFCILSALAGFGGLLRVTVLLVWAAIALDLLLLLRGKGRLMVLAAGAVCAAVLFFGLGFLMRHNRAMPVALPEDGMPTSVNIMMGLKGNGAFNQREFNAVAAIEGKTQRAAYIDEQISATLAEYGAGGMMKHLASKLSYTFGQVTYGASSEIAAHALEDNLVARLFASTGQSYAGFSYVAFAILAAVVFWLATSAVRAVRRKNNSLTFVRLGMLCVLVFQMIFDVRGRYMVCFVPLMIMGAIETMPTLSKKRRQATRPVVVAEAVAVADGGEEGLDTPMVVPPVYWPYYEDEMTHWSEVMPEGWIPEGAQDWDGAGQAPGAEKRDPKAEKAAKKAAKKAEAETEAAPAAEKEAPEAPAAAPQAPGTGQPAQPGEPLIQPPHPPYDTK